MTVSENINYELEKRKESVIIGFGIIIHDKIMISITNLKVRYKTNVIYDKMSVEIPQNGISFLMGKNGAGKTTLIKCILNHMFYEGNIYVNGHPYQNDKKDVFVLFDDSALYKNLSGLSNIILLTGLKNEEIYEYSDPFLNRKLLEKKTKTYSYGERKKLFLIIADIIRPKILIMDEVSNGLDYETMLLLKTKILEWSNKSTVLLTGHQFEFYSNIVDRVYVIKDKSIQCVKKEDNCTLEEIYEKTIK